MPKFFFLSGLPRSGSTLLGSIIGQRPDFTVTPTSPILDLLCATNDTFNMLNQQYTFDFETKSHNVYAALIEGYFKDVATPYVLDKHRGYPRNVVPLKMFFSPDPKILCTVRPIADVIASYITLIQRNGDEDNFVDVGLAAKGQSFTTENRAMFLWSNFLSNAVESLRIGMENFRENLHLVRYDDLVERPGETMDSIYGFFGTDGFSHRFDEIENRCGEDKDAAWGLRNLHKIRGSLKKTSTPAKKVLGRHLEERLNDLGNGLLGL